MDNYKKKRKFKKRFIIFGVLLLIIALVFLFTRAYLYLNFLLGNDIVITLNADKSHFFLKHGESETVSLKSQTFANPFCSLECSSSFKNLNTGEILDEDSFTLKSTLSYTREYNLTSNNIGAGQEFYRFEIKCKSIKKVLCQTSGEEKTRNILVTLDYNLNDYEQEIKNSSKENISLIFQEINNMQANLIEINDNLLILEKNDTSNLLFNDINNLSNSINILNQTCFYLINLWENESYSNLEQEMFGFDEDFQKVKTNFANVNETFYFLTFENNLLFNNFTYAREGLESLKQQNVSFNETLEINSLISKFNLISDNESNYNEIYGLIFEINNFNISGEKCCYASGFLSEVPISEIYLNEINESYSLIFNEKKPVCCFFGKCEDCSNNETNYPIVFVHGHSFNHKVSAEYSFDSFEEMQEKLEEDGFINGGTLISVSNSESEGVFGKLNYPFTFRVSYYFDIFKSSDSVKVIQTKKDNIDTYAIRLNDIIEEIKFQTGKDKVIIISHSMGGIVSRRYMQIFGEDDVYKFISIGSPHHGISKKIYDYCKLFGATAECDDMKADSLLINKINQDILEVPSYSIIGVGCDMNGEDGDGIVENSTAYLDFAQNYYINGSCPGNFEYLHLDMVKPDKYPDVYEIIVEILKE
ncbi:MAG: alpha/beta hydrolase [Candidatus Pacearchaeota archaeon]|jgi:hypothetical protein